MQIQKSAKLFFVILLLISVYVFNSCIGNQTKSRISKVWLIGDSTVANYALEEDYQSKRYPITGWGQVFQQYMSKDSLKLIPLLAKADSVVVDDRAKGGRSTRTFFQEGRWREVFTALQAGDLVLMQFGHNDAAETKTERYVNIEGYKEFLRLFIYQTRVKGGIPILLTPVARNYPWVDGRLENVHGDYPGAMNELAIEMGVQLIDLNQLSMDFFSTKGEEYVSANYFMNLPAGVYEAYPDGQKDNTHFQPAGAMEIARLVFNGMKNLGKN